MSSDDFVNHFVLTYGDLIFDLSESILQNSHVSQIAFRSILKKLRAQSRFLKYAQYERSWVLRITCEKLLTFYQHYGEKLAPENAFHSQEKTQERGFLFHFRRLMQDEQLLLLLKDKFGIPYSEIASALGIPEGSLKVKRQQALQSLEQWLWNPP